MSGLGPRNGLVLGIPGYLVGKLRLGWGKLGLSGGKLDWKGASRRGKERDGGAPIASIAFFLHLPFWVTRVEAGRAYAPLTDEETEARDGAVPENTQRAGG